MVRRRFRCMKMIHVFEICFSLSTRVHTKIVSTIINIWTSFQITVFFSSVRHDKVHCPDPLHGHETSVPLISRPVTWSWSQEPQREPRPGQSTWSGDTQRALFTLSLALCQVGVCLLDGPEPPWRGRRGVQLN